MKNTKPTKITELLHVDFNEQGKIGLTNQKTLQKLVGLLGVCLPVLLLVFLAVDNGHSKPLESISHYYYSRVSSLLVIIVSLLAIFLLVYKGKEHIDFYLSCIAGIFALCLLLFPTTNIIDYCGDNAKSCAVTHLPDSKARAAIHLISAGIFLSSLAFMSLFLFTKSDQPRQLRPRGKKLRNRVYRTCGVVMILALLVMLVFGLTSSNNSFYYCNHMTFWMETVAVESFGFAWLTKAEVFFKD